MAPEVILDFIFDRGLLFAAVVNIGDLPAHKVSVRFKAPLRGLGGKVDIARLAMFQNIEFLAPHKAIQTFLDSSQAFFARNEPTRVKAEIAYVDGKGNSYGGPIEHDLEIYRDIVYLNWPESGQETVRGDIFGPQGIVPGGNQGPLTGLGSSSGVSGPGAVSGSQGGPWTGLSGSGSAGTGAQGIDPNRRF